MDKATKQDKYSNQHFVRLLCSFVVWMFFFALGYAFDKPILGFMFGAAIAFFVFLLVHNIQRNRMKIAQNAAKQLKDSRC